ncbi:TerC family protein [Fangia hongkongensis]|uniref:TerC family protein n=1 Tax=Fangia hongkongensis TaxID=270495 RepID=UPI00037D8A13|nr:TerC family protein [Fangia hongkongensis]
MELIISFITITALETVLAIDNLLFIYLVTSKLPKHQQRKAQVTAISLAAIMRIACLLAISFIMSLTAPLFNIFDNAISTRDLILIGGGLFLMVKAIYEIAALYKPKKAHLQVSYNIVSAIIQIVLIDAVFSIDSVITAIGLTDNTMIIVASILTSCVLMVIASKYLVKLTESVQLKLIALSSLVFIGVILIAQGVDIKIDKSYLLVALGFAAAIYILQKFARKTS